MRGIAVLAAALALTPAAHAAVPRLLFSSDWSGTFEIYAADPSGARPIAQVTFGRPAICYLAACGYANAVPSPNGRLVLYADFAACGVKALRSSLYVARPDDTHARVVARSQSKSGCPQALGAAWSPNSARVAYADHGDVHVVDTNGRHNRVVGRGDQAKWSPDGKSLAFAASNRPLEVRSNGHTRFVGPSADYFEWSPNSRWIAYSFLRSPGGPADVVLVRPTTGDSHLLVETDYVDDPRWSADGRFIAMGGQIIDVTSGKGNQLGRGFLAWQPRGHVFASADKAGISLVDAATGESRLLTTDQAFDAHWSPDGRFLAYVTDTTRYAGIYGFNDLRIVTPTGVTRTLVSSAAAYGYSTTRLIWSRVPSGVRYRRAQHRVLAVIHGDGLTARWTIAGLAADADRVAYTACGHVFVWSVSARTVVQAEPNSALSPRCTTPGNYWPFWLYTLALSGDRIAFGDVSGNSGQSWELYDGRIGDPTSFSVLSYVPSANGCAVGLGGLGDLAGAGDLLIFSTWRDDYHCPARTLEQHILRVDGEACPCPVIAASPGPLVPFDVAEGRIVAGGENATVIYDSSGKQLLAVPVSPLAAQLTGSNLVILEQGHLFVYDATTGARLHDWPLPNVPSGSECASPHSGTWECRNPQLVLEDAARDLAAYVVNGEVHVVQLQNGSDTIVGKGTLARFMNAGLVYAEGADLHVVPFAKLPFG